MKRIKTTHGIFTGKTPDTIVRRVYGRTAKVLLSPDMNNPHAGQVVRTDAHGTHVLARLHWTEDV